MRRLLNFAAFYVGWIACVAGAAAGRFCLGPALAVAILLAHLSSTPQPKAEARFIIAAGLIGFVLESSMAATGLYTFTHSGPIAWLCPPWMVALWMMFASTLNVSLAWLSGRYRLAALLGAVAGPISYLAGARFGAITLPPQETVSILGFALVWAISTPALLWLHQSRLLASRFSALTIGWTIG
jgi:hypothetical protein